MFRYGKIALGCSLSSALYCFYNQIPMIYVERRKIHPFEFFKPNTDLSLLKIEPLRYDLKMSDEGVAVFGPSKQQVYEKIMVLLSLSGLVPFSNLAKSAHIDKKHLKIITEHNRVYKVEYDELIVFDDTKISGLSSILKDNKNQKTQILDWFEINQGSGTKLDYIQTEGDFINQIFLYESKRPDVNQQFKDLVAISRLTSDEAKYEYQNSDTYARFKVLRCMKEAGIRGPKNGKNPNYPERSQEPFKWLSPKITFVKREIVPPPMSKYRNTKKINFCYDTPEQIMSNSDIKINSYPTKLLNAL